MRALSRNEIAAAGDALVDRAVPSRQDQQAKAHAQCGFDFVEPFVALNLLFGQRFQREAKAWLGTRRRAQKRVHFVGHHKGRGTGRERDQKLAATGTQP